VRNAPGEPPQEKSSTNPAGQPNSTKPTPHAKAAPAPRVVTPRTVPDAVWLVGVTANRRGAQGFSEQETQLRTTVTFGAQQRSYW
jgi:hypothetical protein